jgi:hypothetical protein
MHTLGRQRREDDRNMMGRQNFRTRATNVQSAQTAPQRTPAKQPDRQAAQLLVVDERQERLGVPRVALLDGGQDAG